MVVPIIRRICRLNAALSASYLFTILTPTLAHATINQPLIQHCEAEKEHDMSSIIGICAWSYATLQCVPSCDAHGQGFFFP